VVSVTEEVMLHMADTETPQGVLAVATFPQIEPKESGLAMVLDGVRDPGNLGTILRTAEAAGVGQVVTLRGTVDLFSPKVVRGAMGAHFRLPIRADCMWEEMETLLEGKRVLLADASGGTPYDQVDWTAPTTLIVGGEAHGAGRKARALGDERVTILIEGDAESLNVAVATGILLFEAARQRRAAGLATKGSRRDRQA
jgi:TrmH family RNA methyltransferase